MLICDYQVFLKIAILLPIFLTKQIGFMLKIFALCKNHQIAVVYWFLGALSL